MTLTRRHPDTPRATRRHFLFKAIDPIVKASTGMGGGRIGGGGSSRERLSALPAFIVRGRDALTWPHRQTMATAPHPSNHIHMSAYPPVTGRQDRHPRSAVSPCARSRPEYFPSSLPLPVCVRRMPNTSSRNISSTHASWTRPQTHTHTGLAFWGCSSFTYRVDSHNIGYA